jgi:hypothetical protein
MAPKPEEFEDDEVEYEKLSDEECALAKETTYSYTTYLSDSLQQGFVYSARTIGGCFAAVTLAPRAMPFVVNYIVPSAAIPGVVAGTTTAVVGVMSFGLGSKLATMGAETTLEATGNALTYLFGSSKVANEKMVHQNNKGSKLKICKPHNY